MRIQDASNRFVHAPSGSEGVIRDEVDGLLAQRKKIEDMIFRSKYSHIDVASAKLKICVSCYGSERGEKFLAEVVRAVDELQGDINSQTEAGQLLHSVSSFHILSLDVNRRIANIGDILCRELGYKPNEILGKFSWEITAPEWVEVLSSYREQLWTRGYLIHVPTSLLRRDGTRYHAYVSGAVHYGASNRVEGATFVITPRIEAEVSKHGDVTGRDEVIEEAQGQ